MHKIVEPLYLSESNLLVELHLLQAGLHVLLGIGQHDVAGVVVHTATIVDNQIIV